jgi:hypothetical protein
MACRRELALSRTALKPCFRCAKYEGQAMKPQAVESGTGQRINKTGADEAPTASRLKKRKRKAASRGQAERRRRVLSIRDLGWTEDMARNVRARLASFAEDWDDPAMDVYDEP